MNEHYTTMNPSSVVPIGNGVDVSSLLRGRNFGVKQNHDKPFEMNPPIPSYNDEDMKELQEYCSKRGIIGVNFNGMNPKAILQMLKGRTEGRVESVSKKRLLNG